MANVGPVDTAGTLNITTRVVIWSEQEDYMGGEQTDLGGDCIAVWVATTMSCEVPKMLRKSCPYLQSPGCEWPTVLARPKALTGRNCIPAS